MDKHACIYEASNNHVSEYFFLIILSWIVLMHVPL